MSDPRPFHQLLRDLEADLGDYTRLRDLLDQQFAAALEHDGGALEPLAADILQTVQSIDGRRLRRIDLTRALLPRISHPHFEDALALVPAGSRLQAAIKKAWAQLGDLLGECKMRNVRNAALITAQHEIFQRVLSGEDTRTYVAP